LLHDQEKIHVDHDFKLRLRNELSSQGTDEAEIEANLFAAELLMPATFLDRDLRALDLNLLDDDAFTRFAKRYGVSTQALLIRLNSLGYWIA